MTLHYNTTLRPNRDEKAKKASNPNAQIFVRKRPARSLISVKVGLIFGAAHYLVAYWCQRGSENIPEELAQDNSS